MLAWLVQHWIGISITIAVIAYGVWWLVKPVSWRDGEGDNDTLVDIGSIKQLH